MYVAHVKTPKPTGTKARAVVKQKLVGAATADEVRARSRESKSHPEVGYTLEIQVSPGRGLASPEPKCQQLGAASRYPPAIDEEQCLICNYVSVVFLVLCVGSLVEGTCRSESE